ncbi:hypothetical protein BH10BAC5_BH10BAC5_06880 [soil metagenome]
MITHTSHPGGASDDFERILKYFHTLNDFSVDAIYPKGEFAQIYGKYSHFLGYYTEKFFPVIFTFRSFAGYLLKFWKQFFEIRKLIGKNQYDVCIINVSVLISVALAVRSKKINSIVFIRETIIPAGVRKVIFKILIKLCNFFIGVSEFNRKDFVEITGSKNTATLYSSIEENTSLDAAKNELFNAFIKNNRLEDYVSKNYFKIICTATISPRKNQLAIIYAMIELKKAKLLKNLMFLFVGNIDDVGYYNQIEELVLKNELINHCRFLGNIEKYLVYGFLQNMNAFILTSKSEGFPLSIVEAMKFGIPVISTNVGGIGDILNCSNGLLINDNTDSILNGIVKIQDLELTKNLVKSANKDYNNNFNLANNLQILRSIIEKL